MRRLTTLFPSEFLEEHAEELGVVERDRKLQIPAFVSLTADEIIGLTAVAKAIEQHYGEPQDIKWAISKTGDETQLYILQSRPETIWNDTDDDEAKSESNLDSEKPRNKSTAANILDRL